jgi:hypothetical protein
MMKNFMFSAVSGDALMVLTHLLALLRALLRLIWQIIDLSKRNRTSKARVALFEHDHGQLAL